MDDKNSKAKSGNLFSFVTSAFEAIASVFKPKSLTVETPVLNKTSDGLAVKGYDAVAYFAENRAVRGKEEFAYDWNDARWLFASAENRDKFVAQPYAYAPQFGGYCAYAIGRSAIADIDPEVWKIVDDRLYLNLDRSVVKDWEQNLSANIGKGNMNWRVFKNKRQA